MSEPRPADLFAFTDLTTSWCVHVAVTLRVAEPSAGHFALNETAERLLEPGVRIGRRPERHSD